MRIRMDECITTLGGSNNKTESCSHSELSFAILAPLTHERQRLQLCALHTINNLLQPISSDNVDEKRAGKSDVLSFMMCGGIFYEVLRPKIVTKSELNSIADALTIKEEGLYGTAVPSTGAQQETEKCEQSGIDVSASMSWWKAIKSHHRNPILGNYSFEVLEEALSRRNVQLEWYNVNDSQNNNCHDDKDGKVTIGFIINSVEPFDFKSPGSYFSSRRHWFTITRIRRMMKIIDEKVGATEDKPDAIIEETTTGNDTNFLDAETMQPITYESDAWHLINSSSDEIYNLNRDEVDTFLEGVVKEKGSIMKAIMQT